MIMSSLVFLCLLASVATTVLSNAHKCLSNGLIVNGCGDISITVGSCISYNMSTGVLHVGHCLYHFKFDSNVYPGRHILEQV